MAVALSTSTSSARILQCLPSYQKERLFAGYLKSTSLVFPRRPLSRSVVVFARRRNRNSGVASSSSKKKKKSLPRKNDDNNDLEDDPFEALFSMLEEDLKNDKAKLDDNDVDDEFDEEDIDELARQLEEALGDVDMGTVNEAADGVNGDTDELDEEKEEEEEEEEEEEVKLKNWQLRRLAHALKNGRRKVSIKSLAAELCLDRALVLELLRDPPPNILMMSAALPDDPPPPVSVPQVKPTETVMEETSVDEGEPQTDVKEPVHLRQQRWFAQKRLKKAHLKTLEMVYRKSKRPTDSMISSIVHVTNLPRKRIVKWFEDKRAERGVPGQRFPYRRPDMEKTVSTH